MVIVMLVLFGLLVMVSAAMPHRSAYSKFERTRRIDQGDEAKRDSLRYELYHDICFWLGLKEMVLMIALTLLLIDSYGIGRGIVYAIIGFLLYRVLARLPLLRRQLQKLYDAHETKLLAGAQKLRPFARVLYNQPGDIETEIASREELEHIIEQSSRFMEDEETAVMSGAITFASKTVGAYMTARSEIDAITEDEILGPLVLDDLHKTGHSQFPVIDGDLDHIVGIVNIDNFLSVGDRQSRSVRSAMSTSVAYVHKDQTLKEALTVLIDTNQQLLLVLSDDQTTVGLISLGDIVSELFGGPIASSFDHHDPRAAVAARQPR